MGETAGGTVEQVRALVGWAGAGRKLTQTGRVTLADARALVEVLDTGDRMDPVIGDRTFKTKSSEELYHLTLLVEWAKAARLWQAISPLYVLDDLSPDRLGRLRTAGDHDIQRILKALASLSAVHLADESAELTADGRTETARMRGESEPGDALLRILVELTDVDDPRVWRQLLVPASIRLDRLHSVIQDAMGWQNCHMHAFTIDGVRYGRPDGELGFRDERTATLGALLKPGAHFVYTYDFGDSWEHLITVEQFQTASAGPHYPHCVDGAGACPPEDCGGTPGYGDLKAVLADPAHEEHHAMLEWLGLRSAADFAPDRFAGVEGPHRSRWGPSTLSVSVGRWR